MTVKHWEIIKPSDENSIVLDPSCTKRAKLQLTNHEYRPFIITLTEGFHTFEMSFRKETLVGLKKWLSTLNIED